MKAIPNVTIYACDYCGRKIVNKGGCTNHENYCTRNPKNDNPCKSCKHLTVDEETWNECYGDCDLQRTRKTFYCEKRQSYMYGHKLNKKALSESIYANDQQCVPMPNMADGGCKDFILYGTNQ